MIDTTVNKENNEVQWPALLKLAGDNELVYLASRDRLIRESESLILDSDDVIIDSEGRCFELTAHGNKVELNLKPTRYNLADVTHLIQAHEFSKAQVCIVKIQFDSILAAIESLCDQ
ncbi:DUF4144 domain-containing protein [Vibrio neptunius]|uniref:DUF4144 domain-containing protein n=1 Tax=Vibrio neptunius TaxID=170651 RepID=UPI001C5CA052|nr:DUF4144 domain-containing protein [Vibrio neptunius]QXX08220.1 DUF4144 domain-containing protein [Vibrio neptunius]